MLNKIYVGVGAAICLWWAVAAFSGWKSPSFGSGGGYYYGGGRTGGYSGYGGWGGGK